MKPEKNNLPLDDAEQPRHPIQVVSRRTGLSSDVIRVWERRYAVVNPARISGGRRIYSDADIRRLSLLQRVTDAGRRISDVAGLDNDTLARMVDEDRRGGEGVQDTAGGKEKAERLVTDALQAAAALDPERLRQVIATAASELSLAHLLEQMLTPLLRRIGEHWKQGTLRVAQEHMASMVIRQYLMSLLNRSSQNGPAIVLTTPPGHQHELGVLMAAISAESEGWSALYLGPETPAEEIVSAAIQSHAKVVALGLQSESEEQRLMHELRRLRETLPEDTALMISGRFAREHRESLVTLPALLPDTLTEFRELLTTGRSAVSG